MAATCEMEKYFDDLIASIRIDAEESMRKDEEEEEEEERRKTESRSKGKKRKTAKSDGKVGKVEASSRPAAAEAEPARVKKVGEAEVSRSGRKTTTEIDLAGAAVYRAEAEEAHKNHQRAERYAALNKWVATGDPEAKKCWKRWIAEETDELNLREDDPTEDWSDPRAVEAQRYRDFWNGVWAGTFGSFEDTTPILPMRYTDEKPKYGTAHPMRTLQIFSVRIARIKEGLHWPLDVFGIVAARDVLDRNRNVIFDRKRDNCQTIDMENPYLTLTGPTRAVVVLDPVCLEVALQVKGPTESEDKDLSFLALWYVDSGPMKSYVNNRVATSKLSTVELTLGDIVHSVEATISVRVIAGKWPDGFRGVFTANTTSLEDMKIPLLALGNDKLPVAADGTIQLSRRVVCVELDGELRISVMAQCDDDQVVERDSKAFKSKAASRSYGMLEVRSCKMEVTVAWSLLSDNLCFGGKACTSI